MKFIRILIALLLCAWWVMVTPSLFQKGGFENESFVVMQTIFTFVAAGGLLLYGRVDSIELVIASIILMGITLFCTTLLIMPDMVDLLFGDATWNLWDRASRIRMNIIHATLNLIGFSILSTLYLAVRKLVMQGRN